MFCLKHSDYGYRKRVIGRESPTEVGTGCAEPASCSTLRLALSLRPAHFLEKVCLCMHEKKCAKILIYLRNIHQVSYKRKWICPTPSLLDRDWAFSLHLFLSSHLLSSFLFCFLCLATPALDYPHGSTNTGSRDWWYSLFSSLALPGKIAKTWLLYSIP